MGKGIPAYVRRQLERALYTPDDGYAAELFSEARARVTQDIEGLGTHVEDLRAIADDLRSVADRLHKLAEAVAA